MKPAWDPVSYRSKRYLENLLGFGLMAVMVLIFFVYVDRLTISAERASVQQTLSILRQGVQVFMFSKMVDSRQRDFAEYANGNPFALLSRMPEHYAGEYSARDGEQVPAGHWYFDLDSRQAVYRFRNRPLWNEADGDREIRLSLQYAPASNPLPLRLLEVATGNTLAKQQGTD